MAGGAQLFPGDGLPGGAQVLHVVQLHVGEHGDRGVGGVGGVPASAHADLHHRDVHGGLPEGQEGGCDHELEIGGLDSQGRLGLEGVAQEGVQVVGAEGGAVDPDALARGYQVGGGGPPGPQPAGAQGVDQEGAGGAFAVGARHQDHRAAALGVS